MRHNISDKKEGISELCFFLQLEFLYNVLLCVQIYTYNIVVTGFTDFTFYNGSDLSPE